MRAQVEKTLQRLKSSSFVCCCNWSYMYALTRKNCSLLVQFKEDFRSLLYVLKIKIRSSPCGCCFYALNHKPLLIFSVNSRGFNNLLYVSPLTMKRTLHCIMTTILLESSLP